MQRLHLFGRQLLFSLLLLLMVSAIDRAQFPLAKEVGAYIEYVLTAPFEYGPLTTLSEKLSVPEQWVENLPWFRDDTSEQ